MADIIDYLLLEGGGKLTLEDESGSIILQSTVGTRIQNLTAAPSDHSGYSVCMRSGARAKPGKLVLDPYSKTMVLPKYADKPQRTIDERSRRSKLRGSDKPEPNTRFITETITPDDL